MNLHIHTLTTAVISDLSAKQKDELSKALGYRFTTTNDNGYMVIDMEELNNMLSDDPDFDDGKFIKGMLISWDLDLEDVDRVEII